MSDDAPRATPEEEARVRRLLAEARHGEPIPVDVAARLDRVLEQLATEGPVEQAPAAEVVDLAARRRRSAVGMLVAAAAVVVLGVGIGQVVRSQDAGSDSAESSAAASTAAEDSGGSAALGVPAPSADAGGDDPIGPPAGDGSEAGVVAPPVRLTRSGFAAQVARQQSAPGYLSTDSDSVAVEKLTPSDAFMCATADYGPGKLRAALYGDVPAVLAYRPPVGETQTVDLLRCGTGEVLRSTVLQSP